MLAVTVQNDFDAWRDEARSLLSQGVRPEAVLWTTAGPDGETLPGLACRAVVPPRGAIPKLAHVPRQFLELAGRVACHRDASRWGLLYRVLWRLTLGDEAHLLAVESDPDVRAMHVLDKAVRFDAHKMKAFVRFRRVVGQDGESGRELERYVAWHRPEHYVLKPTAPFFARRFGVMTWSILTPDASAHWDPATKSLSFGPGVPRSEAPQGDDLEDLWKTYYASIFNPARVKVRAMVKEMPRRYWSTLPEAELIPDLLHEAQSRTEEMMAKARARAKQDATEYPTAAAFMPERLSLKQLREASAGCRGCPLYKNATQTVFGEGPAAASVMFVGEQPGDQEDLAGKPFVGPAGRVLNDGCDEAGIDRGEVYVTNTVKHFKFEPRGKRRIHSKPNSREIEACVPWLKSEIATVKPKLLVCLGATAAQALLGKQFRVTQRRGQVLSGTPWAPAVVATVHPSSILRAPDEESRERAYRDFVADLKVVRREMEKITQAEADASAAQNATDVETAKREHQGLILPEQVPESGQYRHT